MGAFHTTHAKHGPSAYYLNCFCHLGFLILFTIHINNRLPRFRRQMLENAGDLNVGRARAKHTHVAEVPNSFSIIKRLKAQTRKWVEKTYPLTLAMTGRASKAAAAAASALEWDALALRAAP